MATHDRQKIKGIRNATAGGVVKAQDIDFGEIAINYANDRESLQIRNTVDEVITFGTNKQIDKKIKNLQDQIGTGFTTSATIKKCLDDEIAHRVNGDNTLQSQIGNGFSSTNTIENKIKEVESKIPKLLIKKDTTPDGSTYVSTYALYDGTKQLGEKINIPKDQFLKNTAYSPITKILTLTFILNDGSENVVNIDLNSLVDIYTVGDGLEFKNSDTHIFGVVYGGVDDLFGTATSVSRSDHTHDYLALNGTNQTVAGTVTFTGAVNGNGFYDTSDENLKIFGDDVEIDFEELKKIPKKKFIYKNDNDLNEHIGTSAQEVRKIYPQIVKKSEDDSLKVDYSKLTIVALKAIDELNERLNILEKENSELKKLLK